MMKKMIFLLTAILLLAGCSRSSKQAQGPEVPSLLLGALSFGDRPEQALQSLYTLGYKDAASGEQDEHFDTIPAADGGAVTLLKIVVPADTAGVRYLGLQWANVQLQLDDAGLYSVTLHSPFASPEVTGKRYVALLRALEAKGYRMMRTVVGTSQQEGEAADIVGHRYTSGSSLMQCYINQDPDGTQSISLNFTQQAKQ